MEIDGKVGVLAIIPLVLIFTGLSYMVLLFLVANGAFIELNSLRTHILLMQGEALKWLRWPMLYIRF